MPLGFFWWFGAAKNLSNVAMVGGVEAEAHPEVKRVIEEALAQHVPLWCLLHCACYVGAAAKSTGQQLKLTIGNDAVPHRPLRRWAAHT